MIVKTGVKIGFVEGVILLGLIATVVTAAVKLSSLFVPLFTLLLVFIYHKVLEAEEDVKRELREELRREIERLKKDVKGQFTIAGLFAVFIMLIVTMKLMPDIISYCDSIAATLEEKGYTIAAFLIKLVPASIVISILSAIYYYAKPIILREG